MPFEEQLPRTMPPWLRGPNGFAYNSAVGKRMDAIIQLFRDAVLSKYPDYAATDSLNQIGRERQLPRAPAQSDANYRTRLKGAWDLWGGDNTALTGVGGGAGSHLGMLTELATAGFPMGTTGATIIQHNGVYAQLVSGALSLGAGPAMVNRKDLTGTVPGTLVGFTLDARDQFFSKFAITFPANVASLRAATTDAARLNFIVEKWRPAMATYVGAFVIEVGGGWEWPTTQLWNDGTTWDSDTVHFIPPAS
jgi:hypothetical protein